MMLRNKKTPILILLALLVLLLATACSPSKAEKLNKEGNDAFTQQAFQEALVSYQTAQIEDPELAEPYYNAANALYRQGAYADALKQMQMALSFADQEELAQAGFYNLGNSSYNQQDLQTAVASYTESLLIDPDDQDAKYNLELALQQLQQQQNEEQQEEEQEQEEQEQEQEESQDGESQEEEQQEQSGEEGEEEQEQEQSEEGQEEEQDAEFEEGQESDEGQEGEEPQEEEGEQGEGEQEEEQEQEGQGQPQEGQPDENQEGQLNEQPAPGQRMTEEQAEQLLAAIARDGQTLQEKLGQIFAVPWTPPVQDW